MLVSFNSKTTGVINGERTVYPVEAHEFILGFKWSSLYNVLSTVFILLQEINVGENRRGNQKWTIQKHWAHKRQDEDKQSTILNTTQKAKATRPHQKPRVNISCINPKVPKQYPNCTTTKTIVISYLIVYHDAMLLLAFVWAYFSIFFSIIQFILYSEI